MGTSRLLGRAVLLFFSFLCTHFALTIACVTVADVDVNGKNDIVVVDNRQDITIGYLSVNPTEIDAGVTVEFVHLDETVPDPVGVVVADFENDGDVVRTGERERTCVRVCARVCACVRVCACGVCVRVHALRELGSLSQQSTRSLFPSHRLASPNVF